MNPDYGTAEDLKRLVREAHARGLKVILDVVANHTSWDSVMMATPELYVRDAQGRVQPPNADWIGRREARLREPEDPRLHDRHDGALAARLRRRRLPLRRGRARADRLLGGGAPASSRRSGPDLFLLAEWSTPDLLAKAFDADYAWPFHAALNRVLSLGAPASEIRATWEEERRNFPRGSLHLRFSDNHDEKRAIARFGEPAALAAQALVFTMDGIPLVYNGMEIGDTGESGGPALTERVPIFWPIVARRPEFAAFYREMIALRRRHAALRRGETMWVPSSGPDRVVSFLRRGAGEEVLVAVNLSSQPWTGSVELPAGAAVRRDHPRGAPAAAAGRRHAGATARKVELPALALDAWGFRVFRRATE